MMMLLLLLHNNVAAPALGCRVSVHFIPASSNSQSIDKQATNGSSTEASEFCVGFRLLCIQRNIAISLLHK